MAKACSLCRQEITIKSGHEVLLILVVNHCRIFKETKLKFFHHLQRVKLLLSHQLELKLKVKEEEGIKKIVISFSLLQISDLMISCFLKTARKDFFGIDNPSNKNYLALSLIYLFEKTI